MNKQHKVSEIFSYNQNDIRENKEDKCIMKIRLVYF